MSGNPRYHRNGPHSRSFYPSLTSISSADSGQIYGPTREMGPPPLDFPPQPVEIDLNSSRTIDLHSLRTLPSPSTSGSNTWDPLCQPHACVDASYGSSNMARVPQLPIDGQERGPTQDPLFQWYASNDGPWVPKVIPDVAPEERIPARQTGNRNPISYGTQYRQPNPSDAGSVQFGIPHSDSGYGTRRSADNTSVFSADIPERDQDCQSLVGHVENFQAFQGCNDMLTTRNPKLGDTWAPAPISLGSDSPTLVCQTCHKPVKTQSELKKHHLRHTKPFKCSVDGCPREEGFSTTNDLDRHTRSKHPGIIPESASAKRYYCSFPGCKSKGKTWPRLDNFRSHLKRVHQHNPTTEEEIEAMVQRAESQERASLGIDQQRVCFQPHPVNPLPLADPTIQDNKSEPQWKPQLEMIDCPQPMSPKEPQMDKPIIKSAPQLEKMSHSNIQYSDTVQPLEVFTAPVRIPESKYTVESVLAPAGQTGEAAKTVEDAKSKTLSKSSASAMVSKQNVVSTSDVDLAKAIRAILSSANIPGLSHQDSNCLSLPSAKALLGSTSNLRGKIPNINETQPPCLDTYSAESPGLKQAEEILKTIRNLGYTLQKEPAQPVRQSLVSTSSTKSGNIVTCDRCKKFQGRPCELTKHMKRHDKPYGCTFLTCRKSFGSKNDWKRHENSQHFQVEAWRCDEERPGGGACSKVCYRRQSFEDHLKREHQIPDDTSALKDKLEGCRIGRDCDARFWCGFCVKLVDLKQKGLRAWTERFDHIDDHFMGRRDLPKQNILHWVPVDGSDKPKSLSGNPSNATHSKGTPNDQSPTSSGSSSEPSPSSATGGVGFSPDAITPETDYPANLKRRYSDEGDDSRPKKQSRTTTVSEVTINCCQCNVGHSAIYNKNCVTCSDGHVFCDGCSREYPDP